MTKARTAGYIEFIEKIQKSKNPNDKLFETLIDSFDTKNFLNDPIEVSRDKACELVLLFIEKSTPPLLIK